jgi:predicted transcriptional regulator
MIVADLMSRRIIRACPEDKALDIASMMEDSGIGSVIILDKTGLKGVLTKETFVANIDNISEKDFSEVSAGELMEADIYTISPEKSLASGVDLLLTQKNNVDRIIVADGGDVLGVLTKKDLTRFFHENMSGKFRVSDLMEYEPETVFDYEPLDKVIGLIKNTCVKRVLVMSGDNLAGIISIRDLGLKLFERKKNPGAVEVKSALSAADIMTRDIITVEKGQDAAKAAGIMYERSIGGMPVLADGRLEGIITRNNLLKGFQLTL